MKRIIYTARFLAAAVATTVALGFATLAEAATVTYDYVGNGFNETTFTSVFNPGGTPPAAEAHSLGSSINASVTFDAAFVTSSFTGVISLSQNAGYLLGYTISSSGATYGDAAGGVLKALSITFTNGLITEWDLAVRKATVDVLDGTWKTQYVKGIGSPSDSLYQIDTVSGVFPDTFTIYRDIIARPGT